MESKELRIGNLILNHDNIDVVSIWHLQVLSSDQDNFFTPIPISEEILFKCGFKKDVGLFMIIKINDGYRFWTGRETVGTDIYYLHQLQNLYYFMSGGQEINTSGITKLT